MAVRKNLKRSSVPEFTQLNDVASARNGAEILFATDDFFAVAENLIKDEDPTWKEGEYTEFGKWMDGWETRRKRVPGHDYCIIALAAPSVITGVEFNTAYFTGNHAPFVSLQAALCDASEFETTKRNSVLGSAASDREIQEMSNRTEDWDVILPARTLQPGYSDTCHNFFDIEHNNSWSHIRLNLFPDGGVARLRVYGRVSAPCSVTVGNNESFLDLALFTNGGECLEYSDAHFGHPRNLIRPNRALSMADGWETARRLDRPPILQRTQDGEIDYKTCEEWCILKLGMEGIITEVHIDTNHFKGNPPNRVRIDGGLEKNGTTQWAQVLPFQNVQGDKEQIFKIERISQVAVNRVRVTVVPDGGISRLRIIGRPI